MADNIILEDISSSPRRVSVPLLYPGLAPLYGKAGPLAYAFLRIVVGIVIITHGVPKVFHLPHGSMADPLGLTAQMISDTLHLPGARFLASCIGMLELVGGAMLALGLFTRVVAPMFAIEMLIICFTLAPNWAWFDVGMESIGARSRRPLFFVWWRAALFRRFRDR